VNFDYKGPLLHCVVCEEPLVDRWGQAYDPLRCSICGGAVCGQHARARTPVCLNCQPLTETEMADQAAARARRARDPEQSL